jgi:hypothetical protein
MTMPTVVPGRSVERPQSTWLGGPWLCATIKVFAKHTKDGLARQVLCTPIVRGRHRIVLFRTCVPGMHAEQTSKNAQQTWEKQVL